MVLHQAGTQAGAREGDQRHLPRFPEVSGSGPPPRLLSPPRGLSQSRPQDPDPEPRESDHRQWSSESREPRQELQESSWEDRPEPWR